MNIDNKISVVLLGASGLVGSQLLQLLVANEQVAKILLIARREQVNTHPKIEELVVDFDKPEEWKNRIQGDVLYSAFGTTIKKAGSKKEQYKIDYTYQWQVAKAAAENGISTYVLISAVGANAKSKVFYNRIKGELDRDVKMLLFKNIVILKPSLLLGDRKEHRGGEKIAAVLGKCFKYLPFVKKYRPINDIIVAKAMLNSSFRFKGIEEFVANELFDLANEKYL